MADRSDIVDIDIDAIPIPPPLTEPIDLVHCRLIHYYPYDGEYDSGKRASYALKRALPRWAYDLGETWFFNGLKEEVVGDEALNFRGERYCPREGTVKENLSRIAPFLGSWAPSHEQKAAMVGLLFYRLFKESE